MKILRLSHIIACLASLFVTSMAGAQTTPPLSTSAYSALTSGKPIRFLGNMDIGVSAGTTGLGIDVSSAITDWMGVRAGFVYMPEVKPNIEFTILSMEKDGEKLTPTAFNKMASLLKDVTGFEVDNIVNTTAVPDFYNFHLLFDFYPFRNKHWHLTAGVYAGPSTIAECYNGTEDMPALFAVCMYNHIYDKYYNDEPLYNDFSLDPVIGERLMEQGRIGVYMGKRNDGTPYMMEPDENSMVRVKMKVNPVRPYVGFGYGGRLMKNTDDYHVSFDCGLMMWGGSPSFITHDGTDLTDDMSYVHDKAGRLVRAMNKFVAYPVLNVRFTRKLY